MLRAALDAALAGRGALVLIGGEAGIGKTALAEALLRRGDGAGRAGAGRALLRPRRDAALRPLARALRPRSRARRPARPAAGGATARARRRGAEQPGRHLRAGRAATLAAARRAPARWSSCSTTCTGPTPPPSTCCASSRRGTRDAAPAAPRHLPRRRARRAATRSTPCCPPSCARPAPTRLDLRPLDDAAIGALVAARYALPARRIATAWWAIWPGAPRATPSSWANCCATLEEDGRCCAAAAATRWALGDLAGVPVPPLLRQVIDGRLARLARRTGGCWRVAAVIGQEVPLALWAAVGEVDEDGAARPRRAGGRGAAAGRDARWRGGALRPRADPRGALRGTAGRRAGASGTAGSARRWLAAPEPRPRRGGLPLPAGGRPARGRVAGPRRRAGARVGAAHAAAERFAAAAALLDGGRARARERGWLLFLGAQAAALRRYRARRCASWTRPKPWRVGGRPGAGRASIDVHARPCALPSPARSPRRGWRRWSGGSPRRWRRCPPSTAGGRRRGRAGTARGTPPSGRPGDAATDACACAPSRLALARHPCELVRLAGRYRAARAMGEATRRRCPGRRPRRVSMPTGVSGSPRPRGAGSAGARRGANTRCGVPHLRAPTTCTWSSTSSGRAAARVLPYQADDLPERARLAAEVGAGLGNGARAQHPRTPYPSQPSCRSALLEGRWAEARRLAEAGVRPATIGHAQSAGAALGVLAR